MSLSFIVLNSSKCSQQTKECLTSYSDCIKDCDDELCKLNCGDSFKSCTGTKYIFPVHFCVVTSAYTESDEDIIVQLKKEITILNKYFTAEDPSQPDGRRRIVTFKYKSASLFSDIEAIESDFLNEITSSTNYDRSKKNRIQKKFNAETNRLIRDPKAINIYIYDSWSSSSYWSNNDGHARNNSDRPYILLDYERLDHNLMAPEEHEMGHAFGLAHVCSNLTNNIMRSSRRYPANNSYSSADADEYIDECSHGGGTREDGFNSNQCRIILENAKDIHDALRL